MKLTYYLPKQDMASTARGGDISRILGVVSGFLQNGTRIEVIGEENLKNYFGNELKVHEIKKTVGNSIFSMVLFAYKGWKATLKKENDATLVWKNIGIIILGIITFNFRLIGKPDNLYWEVHGLSAQYLKDSSIGSVLYKFILILHKIVLREGRCIFVVSHGLKRELTTGILAIPSGDVVVSPNGSPKWMGPNYRSKDKKVKFVYLGVFQPYNDFETIIKAFEKIEEKYKSVVELHFCGYGSEERVIKKASEERDNIFFWGPQSPEFLYNQKLATNKSIGLIPMSNTISVQFQSPVKLFDYLSFGMPILTTDIVNLKNELEEHELIFRYKNFDINSLANSMMFFVNNDINWNYYHDLAKKSTENNSWDERMKLLKNIIQEREG